MLLRGPESIEQDIAATFDRAIGVGALHSRAAVYRDLLEAPLVGGLGDGFQLIELVSACYTAIAVIAALTLSAARRVARRPAAYDGPERQQSLWLTVVEQAPRGLPGVLPGLALGIGIA